MYGYFTDANAVYSICNSYYQFTIFWSVMPFIIFITRYSDVDTNNVLHCVIVHLRISSLVILKLTKPLEFLYFKFVITLYKYMYVNTVSPINIKGGRVHQWYMS